MAMCIKCGGDLTKRRNCKRCGPQPPTHVTKLKDLIFLAKKTKAESEAPQCL